MNSRMRPIRMLKGGAALSLVAILAACGGGETSSKDSDTSAVSETSGPESNGSDSADESTAGSEYYVENIPNPCSMLTEAVAQDILNVGEVHAAPNNSGPESLNPRCAYRDGEQKSKNVSIIVIRMPYSAINSSMSSEELRALADQNYGHPRTPYKIIDQGPGEHRFVSEDSDMVTMFVMSGLAIFGGTYDYKTKSAEAAFAVTLRDLERTAEERLTAARRLAVEYNAALISAAEKQ